MHILAIDQGTSGTKAIVTGETGQVAGSPAAATVSRLTAADGTVQAGNVAGAVLRSSAGTFAVLSGTGPAGTVVSTPIRYHVPAGNTRNVVSDLSPNTTYAVTSTPDATGVRVQIQPGTGTKASAAGVLSFTTPTSGGGGNPGSCVSSGGGGDFQSTAFSSHTGTFTAGWDVTRRPRPLTARWACPRVRPPAGPAWPRSCGSGPTAPSTPATAGPTRPRR